MGENALNATEPGSQYAFQVHPSIPSSTLAASTFAAKAKRRRTRSATLTVLPVLGATADYSQSSRPRHSRGRVPKQFQT